MERALRQTVVIGPGGTFEGKAPGVAPGTSAEVIVLFTEENAVEAPGSESANPKTDRDAWVASLRAMSDEAIAEGMETWSLDRINQEIHERRGGR